MEIRLAPMCGITDHIYRTLCFEQGCDAAYTEMISATGYLCAPNQRAVRQLMVRGETEKKLTIQLFGKDPDNVAEAAEIISGLGIYDGIDLNMGCPARKIAGSGEGCGLMKTPDIARKMMEKTVRHSSLPVSVKMRAGWDGEHINAVELARIAEDSGISEITVHGRTREQQYSGKADWDIIEAVKQSVHIPVIGNGDIFTAEEAVGRIRQTHVDGIMIARGVLGNPWIFREIKELLSGKEPTQVSLKERRDTIFRHYKMLNLSSPSHIAVREMRKYIGWYIHGMRGSARIRDEINRCGGMTEVLDILDAFFRKSEAETTEE